jgi:hypothetical protein
MHGNRAFLDRSVVLTNGEETAVEVAMVPIRVFGTVFRGLQSRKAYGREKRLSSEGWDSHSG